MNLWLVPVDADALLGIAEVSVADSNVINQDGTEAEVFMTIEIDLPVDEGQEVIGLQMQKRRANVVRVGCRCLSLLYLNDNRPEPDCEDFGMRTEGAVRIGFCNTPVYK